MVALTFVAPNNEVLDHFSPEERLRIGVLTCPGGDRDATHSADVNYAGLLPDLFPLSAASEKDPQHVLRIIQKHIQPGQVVFVGVIDPIDTAVETSDQVCDRVLQAAELLSLAQLATTDDCGFSPFADHTSTSRDLAFQKIWERVEGTRKAANGSFIGGTL
jgi:5-methyltetrahydropteroyltriglutamate--homocysteine methyltransferase